MTLLVIVITFVIQRYLGLGENFSRVNWFVHYLKRMQSVLRRTGLWANIAGIILTILPVVILVALGQWFLRGWFFGIWRFFYDLLFLWLCLDAYQLRAKLTEYLTALAQDQGPDIYSHGVKFLRRQEVDSNTPAVARAITVEIFLRSEERLFGVLFWFIVLGPFATVTYFLIMLIRDLAAEPNSAFVELLNPATKLCGILDWIPVRITGLSYALIGHFKTGFNYFRKKVSAGISQTQQYAVESGFAALNIEHVDVIHADLEENQEALSLVDRAVYVWIVVVAIFTLGGWM